MNDNIQAGLLRRVLVSGNSAKAIFFAALAATLVVLFQPTSPAGKVATAAQTSPTPPCGDSYGSSSDRSAIEQAMYSGTEAAVISAINNAKATRGNRVGCTDQTYTLSTGLANYVEPPLSTVAQNWESVHAPGIAGFTTPSCPKLSRDWGAEALGGYYAKLAGYSADLSKMALMADALEAQQYKDAYAPPLTLPAGSFGYINAPLLDPCRLSGTAGNSVATLCSTYPDLCITYDAGMWAGKSFAVADIKASANFFDGGIAYDQGWGGAMMIEASIQQTSQTLRDKYRASALLAGDWADSEPRRCATTTTPPN